ncbi:hypothetical protein [Actinoplanes sp. N902-109]|uniref:hypothetical protein n=1 Tax=Actinoplanes sp. (strain N902-109) TaxID=649831 RepID=UPI0003293AC3|nr:hypothetical protein [Actinoplanes sp. N902-109]AGL18955.1 hypothetical protein L083_5445 [Actinoplanes sp. N902-109]
MIADVIRPGSVLSDPGERAGWEQHGLRSPDSADMTTILAAYPWQPFPYRYGRWQAEQVAWKALVSFELWTSYKWGREESSFQVLDPRAGMTVLNELTAPPQLLSKPGGTVEIAGDPQTIGVYRVPGTAADRYWLGLSLHLDRTIQRQGVELLRQGGDRLPPAYETVDYPRLDGGRAWYRESPQQPHRRPDWRAAENADLYRPGGVNPFTGKPVNPDGGKRGGWR